MMYYIVKEFGRDPFLILIACLLGLRTKDIICLPVCRKLFKQAKTPQELLAIPLHELHRILYPLGFYRRKSLLVHSVSKDIIETFAGVVPHTQEQLRSISGVGIKTANLVLGIGFGIPALCVDTHVHRISNRLGIIKTKTPEETERALKKVVPEHHWIEFNELLVMWGQNICVPISPWCSKCPLFDLCKRVDVTKSR